MGKKTSSVWLKLPSFGEYLEMVISHLWLGVQTSNLVPFLASHEDCACKFLCKTVPQV